MRITKLLLIAGLLISPSAFAETKSCLIAIDIGHTRKAPGSISSRGVTELQFNTVLAKRLHASLEKLGVPSVLLNTNGDQASLQERPQSAEKAGATLFISIHHDSTQPRYMSTWQWEGNEHNYSDRFSGYGLFVSKKNPYFNESLRLAKEISDKLLSSGLPPNLEHAEPIHGEGRPLLDTARGIYQYDDLVVLKLATMPAILIESGVIVNRDEELRVSTADYQDKIISAVTAAAVDHCSRLTIKE